MAALTITVPDLAIVSASPSIEVAQAAVALVPGELVYSDSNGKADKADADAADTAVIWGMALSYAAADEYLVILKAGRVEFGSILTAGTVYYAHPTAGAIGPHGDILSGDTVSQFGSAYSTTQMDVEIRNSLTTVP